MTRLIQKIAKIFVAIAFFSFSFLSAKENNREKKLNEDGNTLLERCKRYAAQFYSLEDNEEFKEITEDILKSSDTIESVKEKILSTGRRFFLFKYPSDGFQVKGFLSFVQEGFENPLLIFLRGGSQIFGLMHPATDLTTTRNYTVIATVYRGGVSEGVDEYGGKEVNDVYHLMHYFPILQEKLGLSFTPSKKFLLGGSRGGMEMFLALGRSIQLQDQIDKAASLSGILDMEEFIRSRKDMKKEFIEDFGLIPKKNKNEWIRLRNPLEAVKKIRKDLPILIIQGTDDIRVSLKNGYRMVKALQKNGNPVTYLEFPNAEHCLIDRDDRMELIGDWFDS